MRRVRALIIVGDEEDHVEESVLQQQTLETKFGIPVTIIKAAKVRRSALRQLIHKALRPLDDHLLLIYNSHGSPEGWQIGTERHPKVFYYTELAELLKVRQGSTLILNETCYGSALMPIAEEKLSSSRVGIIGAESTDLLSYSYHLVPAVLRSWINKQVYPTGRVYQSVYREFQESMTVRVGNIPLTIPMEVSERSIKISHYISNVIDLVMRREPYDRVDSYRWGLQCDQNFFPQIIDRAKVELLVRVTNLLRPLPPL